MTTYSVPNTFTASTVISSSEMNANFTAVATSFGVSLGLDGADVMTGTFKAVNGTVGLPGITFGSDPDLGLYRSAANVLGISASGAAVATWGASALALLTPLTITASSAHITLTDSDTGADNRIDADNANGSLAYRADMNDEAANSVHLWTLDGTNEMVLNTTALYPDSDDGLALGTTSRKWADLFLASGAVINFNSGNATLTHSANTLNFAVTNLQHGGVAIATASDVQGIDVQQFTSSGTWTKPAGYNASCPVLVRAWGGGGGGATGDGSDDGGGGGGGGACVDVWCRLSDLGATETVTVGSGGAAQTSTNQDGNAGGTTTFGGFMSAYGGAGGVDANTNSFGGGGGGGAGVAGAGNADNSGDGENGGAGGSPDGAAAGANGYFGGGGGGNEDNNGGASVYGGGGGGGGGAVSGTGGDGGASVSGGGGGGGGGASASSGGTSTTGGAGGAGGNGTGTAGSQPGGGGGGCVGSTSGAGADGQVEVYVFPV